MDVQVGVKAHCGYARAQFGWKGRTYAAPPIRQKSARGNLPGDNQLIVRAYFCRPTKPAGL